MTTSKTDKIQELFRDYCKSHLDDEYLRLCNKLFDDLLAGDQEIFKRGKENIWAAALVWAIGSVNFLGDKSFDPYASLSDVCEYFSANTSSVGQKASMIRNFLDINVFNPDYQRNDSSIAGFLDNLVMNEYGMIIPRSIAKEKIEEEVDYEEEEEEPLDYIIILEARRKYSQADIYQLEYLFKTFLEDDEFFQKTELSGFRLLLYFFGRPAKILH